MEALCSRMRKLVTRTVSLLETLFPHDQKKIRKEKKGKEKNGRKIEKRDGGKPASWNPTPPNTFLEIPNVQKPPSMGGGTFRGFYGTINAQQTVIANETAVAYTQYRCDVGTPYGKLSPFVGYKG